MLPLPPIDLINKLPGAAPPSPVADKDAADGGAAEKAPFVDPILFLEGLVGDRVLRKSLHPSARTALETVLVAVSTKAGQGDLAIGMSLLRVGDILGEAAEGRERAMHHAVEAFRVALALMGETLGRNHHVTVKARKRLADALTAAGRRVEAAAELETIVDTLDGEAGGDVLRAAAHAGLKKLDTHPTISATMRRARRKKTKEEVDEINAAAPISYGRFAGRTPTEEDAGPVPRLAGGADDASIETAQTADDTFASHWKRLPHPDIPGASYFWNEATGETSNDTPPGFLMDKGLGNNT